MVSPEPILSIAPTSYKTFIADCTDSVDGGWGAWSKKCMQLFANPLARIDMQTSSKGTRRSSGSFVAFMTLSAVVDEYSLRHIPDCTRPARPCLCLADDFGHQSVTSIDVEVFLFRRTSRTRPVSITYTTSGIVTLVSAMLVAQMIFLHPGFDGRNARRWSREDNVECSGIRSKRCRSLNILLPSNRSAKAFISPSPGRNIKMEPLVMSPPSGATKA
mmetsp:Transcript_18153/g.33005  ORF Transcript_18153/g.33005 Transcript_18153/m.33005 type:complete len:217 (-) Transcript_18153:1118-1768(-)